MSDENSIQNIANMKITKGSLNWENYGMTSGEVKIVLPCGTEITVTSCVNDEDERHVSSTLTVTHPSDKLETKIYGKDGHTMKVSKRTKQTTYKYGTYTYANIAFKSEKKQELWDSQ
jgi:hypothetical protein